MSKTKDLDSIFNEVDKSYPVTKSQVALQGLFIDIALAISKMRLYRSVSQRELANRMQTAQSTVARWETPGYDSYTLTKLSEIADALDYSLQLAFKDKGDTHTKTVYCESWNRSSSRRVTDHSLLARPVSQWQPTIQQIQPYMQEVTV